MGLKRIEAVTTLVKLESLRQALDRIGVNGMTVVQALGYGAEKGTQEYEINEKRVPDFLSKQIVIVYVTDEQLDKTVDVIKKELYSGHIGDGKIFISEVTNIIRVRTGEEGADALRPSSV